MHKMAKIGSLRRYVVRVVSGPNSLPLLPTKGRRRASLGRPVPPFLHWLRNFQSKPLLSHTSVMDNAHPT